MYGLPRDFDFTPFRGRTLQRVSFASNNVVLYFGDDLFIQVESSWSIRASPSKPETHESLPLERSELPLLLDKAVARAETPGGGTLVIHFEDGASFQCFEDVPNYECYQISIQGRRTIV